MSDSVDRAAIGRFYGRTWDRWYVRMKLRSDPIFRRVVPLLLPINGPIVDLGCGLGILPMLLRASGFEAPIVAIDFDAGKIARATKAARRAAFDIDFRVGDVRSIDVGSGHVVMLDLLHYFAREERRLLVRRAIDISGTDHDVVIRDCIADGSWRYRATLMEEMFATGIGWLRGERLDFPDRRELTEPFEEAGRAVTFEPLWGRTPFNNHLVHSPAPQRSAETGGMTAR